MDLTWFQGMLEIKPCTNFGLFDNVIYSITTFIMNLIKVVLAIVSQTSLKCYRALALEFQEKVLYPSSFIYSITTFIMNLIKVVLAIVSQT